MLKWLRNTGQNIWGKGDRVYGLISEKESKLEANGGQNSVHSMGNPQL